MKTGSVISGNMWANITSPTQHNMSIYFPYIFMLVVSTYEKFNWKQGQLYSSYLVTNEKYLYLAISFETLCS